MSHCSPYLFFGYRCIIDIIFAPTAVRDPHLAIGVLRLKATGLDDVHSHQALLSAVGGEQAELARGHGCGGVIRQGVDLKHALRLEHKSV